MENGAVADRLFQDPRWKRTMLRSGLKATVRWLTVRLMSMFSTTLGRLRLIGWAEGVSFLLLLGVAMPLKYLAGEPGMVRVVGMAHGVLFLLYGAAALQATVAYGWTWRRCAVLLAASLLPAGPFVVDAKVLRPAELELKDA